MNQPKKKKKKNHQYSTGILLRMQRMLDFYLVNSFRPCDADKTHLSIIIWMGGEREREESLITITTTSQHFLFEDCSTSAVPAHKREKPFLTHTHTHTHTHTRVRANHHMETHSLTLTESFCSPQLWEAL